MAPQPKQATPKRAARVEGVEVGDHVYVRHPFQGPTTLRVRSAGRDGFIGRCEAGKDHRLGWDTYLGHKTRVLSTFDVVDQGADGAILADGKGRRRYLAGGTPIGDQPAAPEPAKRDDPLLDRSVAKSDPLAEASDLLAKAEQLALALMPAKVEGYTRADGTAVAPHVRIVRVHRVVDTREYEQGEGDRWHPIPGSGKPRPCDRCGRTHEVHADVETSAGARICVGTGCMTAESAEVQSKVQTAAAAAKTLARLEAQDAHLRRRQTEYDQHRTQVESMPLPAFEERAAARSDGRRTFAMGDAEVHGWIKSTADLEERKGAATRAWRERRMRELGAVPVYWPENWDKRLARARAVAEGDTMAKSVPTLLLFMKAGQVANRPGLALKDVTDKAGHQTKRWSRTNPDEGGDKRPKAAMKHGDVVRFRHGDVEGQGKIVASGADGVTVHDAQGQAHQVRHEHLVGPASGGRRDPGRVGYNASPESAPTTATREEQDAAIERRMKEGEEEPAGATDAAGGGEKPRGEAAAGAGTEQKQGDGAAGAGAAGGGDGGGEPPGHNQIPPDKFTASAIYEAQNDPNATAETVLAQFPPEVAEHVDAMRKKVAGLRQTQDVHKVDGAYTPERRKLHLKIIGHILSPEAVARAKPPEGQKPTFTILGGRGGSGKSAFKGMVYDPATAIVLDADEIKQAMPEYKGWNAAELHEESGDIFDEITAIAAQHGLNLVHDATMKTAKKAVALVNHMKGLGYRTEAHYMHLPRQEAAKRAVDRFRTGKGDFKGRFVPPEVVLSNTGNEASFDQVKGLVDKWSFRDNNVPKGQPPRLISESADGDHPGTDGRHGLPAAGGDEAGGRSSGASSRSGGGRPAGGGFPPGHPGAYGPTREAIAKALEGAGRIVFLLPHPGRRRRFNTTSHAE